MQSDIDLDKDEAAAFYAHSIERERAARQAMESLPFGSRERAQALQKWSEAIVCTNRAWRCLRGSKAGGVQQAAPVRAGSPHAGA